MKRPTLLVLLVVVIFSAPLSVKGTTQHDIDGALLDILPKSEQQLLLVFNSMSDKQKESLAMVLIGFYFAGLENHVEESTIDGRFSGWRGETIVQLTNGAIFQQSEYHYEYTYDYRPTVHIFTKPFGYEMLVEGTDEPVEVMLIKAPTLKNSFIEMHEKIKQLLLNLDEPIIPRIFALW